MVLAEGPRSNLTKLRTVAGSVSTRSDWLLPKLLSGLSEVTYASAIGASPIEAEAGSGLVATNTAAANMSTESERAIVRRPVADIKVFEPCMVWTPSHRAEER